MKKPFQSTDCVTVHEAYMWSEQLGSKEHPYWRGVVFTKQGIVATYRQTHNDYTKLFFVWQGKVYARNIAAYYSDRYTVTLARRFAEEITGGKE